MLTAQFVDAGRPQTSTVSLLDLYEQILLCYERHLFFKFSHLASSPCT